MSNPAVTFRVEPRARERLDALTAKTGKSLGQVLRESLGVAEREEGATYDRGWTAGYAKGLKEGEERGRKAAFGRVNLPCSKCGKTFEMNFYDHKEAAGVLLNAFGKWAHRDCLR